MHSDANSRDFYHVFYGNCDFFNIFFLQFCLWEWKDSDLFERVLHFQKGFFGEVGEKILKNVKWAQFEAVVPTCGDHCPEIL